MSFDDDINKLADRYKRRMRAVVQESTQRTVAMAQQVRGEGGRMRVDTGFLKASGGASLESPPTGPTDNEGIAITGQLTGQPLPVILATWQPGQDIYWGWTANYARAREAKDGFARGAAEKWPDTVKQVAREAARR